MTWYALRTTPGAQMPQRTYSWEGRRLVPSLDPNVSAIERALSDNGFVTYMPSEKRLVRDRRRNYLWKARRFALMVGYVFVRDPHDWYLLSETPGVAGVVGVRGKPLPVDIADILMVRTMEADAEVEFDRQARNARSTIRKRAKHDPRFRKLVEGFDMAGTISLPVEELAA